MPISTTKTLIRSMLMAGRLLGFDIRDAIPPLACSVDVCAWPRISDASWSTTVSRIAQESRRKCDTIVNDVNLLACLPVRWLTENPFVCGEAKIIAIAASDKHAARLEQFYPDLFSWYHCNLSESDLTQAGWPLLGYDVVDVMLTASWVAIELENGAPRIESLYGLYDSLGQAEAQVLLANREVPEHGSFSVVRVYGHPSEFSNQKGHA